MLTDWHKREPTMKRIVITAIVTFALTAFAVHAVQTAFTGAGVIESTVGGFKFPDGSVQTTAVADNLSSRVAELEASVFTLQTKQLRAVDGIGQQVGEIVDFDCGQASYWYQCIPIVALNIEGNTAFFQVRDYGLVDVAAARSEIPTSVYYLNSNCGGGLDSYVSSVPTTGVFSANGVRYAVGGPDETLGIYTLHRATSSTPPQWVTINSRWKDGVCFVFEETLNLVPAEEITGLEGFLGPSLIEPELKWSVTGGTIIPPP